jgi:hypothetical protein
MNTAIESLFRPAPAPMVLTASPTAGFGKTSAMMAERLKELDRPTPSGFPSVKQPKSVEEQLYDALASFKLQTAAVAMHLDRDWRYRLFRQFDSLLAIEDWEVSDQPPSIGSFSTFLRMLIFLKPERRPGLGASSDQTIIASWTVGSDRLTMECLPRDVIRWHLSVSIDNNQERAAGLTPVQRLATVLAPYKPERWFNADNVPAR